MIQKKKIRTYVITGRGIFAFLVGVLGLIAVSMIISLTARFPEISPKYGMRVVKMGMNDIKWEFLKYKKILGLNFGDNRELLYNYYGIFGKIKIPNEEPVEKIENEATSVLATSDVTEFKIEAINGAKGMAVSNLSGISVDAETLSREKIDIALTGSGPQVLIIHTHTTESFTDPGKSGYTLSDSDRSTDSEKNMVAVGKVIKETLEGEGIEVIHDTTVHDYPSFSGAYTRSMVTVEKNLKEHPTIKLVLDVHRDGIVGKDGTKLKVLANINGKNAAQCMFVVGSNALLQHDNWILNMRLACNLQKYANENYPGLMRAINLRKERFNQQVPARSIIIEVGSNGNTLEEARCGAELMAKTVAAVLKGK